MQEFEQLGIGVSADIDPHADDADATATGGDLGELAQLGHAVGGRLAIEEGMADRQQQHVGGVPFGERWDEVFNSDSQRYAGSNYGNEGNRSEAQSPWAASVWADYHFTGQALEGVTLGGGARYTGKNFGDSTIAPIRWMTSGRCSGTAWPY